VWSTKQPHGAFQGRMLKLIGHDVEGYLVGRLAIAVLEKTGAELSRDGLLTTIRTIGKFTILGLVMTFGPDKNDGLDDVFLTVIQTDGSFKPVPKLTM
jgi:branched-chain amino acid transport system substrate-binding protein